MASSDFVVRVIRQWWMISKQKSCCDVSVCKFESDIVNALKVIADKWKLMMVAIDLEI